MKSFYNIIHTSSRVLWGNREKRILCESLWMKENGHQVAIVAPGASPLFEKAKQNKLKTYPMSFKALARIGEYGRLKQIFYGEQPFVVNAHGRGDAKLALKAAQSTGVPCRIISRHNGKRVKSTWPNKKIYKTLCHYVFTASKDSTTHLKQTFFLSDMQIFSIPDGIAVPDAGAAPDKTAKTAARHKLANTLGLGTDARFIGIFGKIAPKRIQQLSRHFPFHHLVIAGIPENQNPKNKNSKKQDSMDEKAIPRVYMLSLPEKNDAYYQALDCFIYFPDPQNFYQGVPWEVTRAMAFFCPVIGPDAPGIRDILINNKTGRVFDPDQPCSLPEIIRWTLNTPQAVQTLTWAARALIEKHYTMDAMGRDVLRIYRLRQVKIDRQLQTNDHETTLV